MSIFIKFALVTSALYVGFAILMHLALFAMTLWKGSAGVFAGRGGWMLTFGVFWLASFTIAWRIVITPLFGSHVVK